MILGGAIAGGSAALLLKRERPELSVLVVEKQRVFDAKVGEATTEMSALFLTRRLALWQHLEREHLPKEGLRYWFGNAEVHGHANASEAGAFLRSSIPAFQLRRDVLDEHVLAEAVAAGAELLRPARAIDLVVGEYDHRVTLETSDGPREIACRWLLDATGRATFVGKRLGLIAKNEEHPTSAVWCRWTGLRHLDDVAARAAQKGGTLAGGNVCSRRLATNHYMGLGYWVWVIPLGNGETSIGVVFDRRLISLDLAGSARRAAYEKFLRDIPALAELLDGATLRGEDLRGYSQLAYVSRQFAGPGWALLGDAAAFLDPYYSPGLDHVGFTVEATVALVLAEMAAESKRAEIEKTIAVHNETFVRSYERFFRAIYQDKYYYMGEFDLLVASSLLDTAQYYIFVVIPAYRIFKRFHWMPVLGQREAFLSYHLMRIANRRFQRIATARREAGEEGKRNHGRRIAMRFDLGWNPFRMALRGLKLWAWAELDLVRLRFGRLFGKKAMPRPAEAAPSSQSVS